MCVGLTVLKGCEERWITEAERIHSHARFPEAVIRFGEAAMALYAGDWASNRAIGQHRRYGVAALIIHFDKVFQNGRGPPATRARIVDLATNAELGTRRGIRGIIGVLLHCGFVAEIPAADRRARRLIPTPRLLAMLSSSLAIRLDAAQLVGGSSASPTVSAGEALARYLAELIAPLTDRAEQPRQSFPELEPFAARVGGYLVLFSLLSAAERLGPDQPTRVHTSEFARKLHVSRAQVIKILSSAEQCGVLSLLPPGRIVWSPAAKARLRFFVALELSRASCAISPPESKAR